MLVLRDNLHCRVIPAGGCGSAGDESAAEALELARQQRRQESKGPVTAKRTSRVSSIKKMLNKKMKVNSHIRFDEDGEQTEGGTAGNVDTESFGDSDSAESVAPIPLARCKESLEEGGEGLRKSVGGICIQEAQRKLRVRDVVDRNSEKVRIRQLHREKKRKAKPHSMEDDGVMLAGLDPGDSSLRPGEEHGCLSGESGHKLGEKRKQKGEGHGGKRKKSKGEGAELKWRSELLGTDPRVELLDEEQLAKHLLGI